MNTQSDQGYLSEVISQHSYNPSESEDQDLHHNFTILEKHFKDKYKVLRSAYEQRLKQFSDVVQETCTNLFADELLNEMKMDSTTSAFIPAHLSEIINRHLEGERENFIHQILAKLSTSEVENSKMAEVNTNLLKKIGNLEKEIHSKNQTELLYKNKVEKLVELEKYSNEMKTELELKNKNLDELYNKEKDLIELVNSLNEQIITKSNEYDALSMELQLQSRDIDQYEKSFIQSSRELAIIEGMDKQEQLLKKEIKQQLLSVTDQRNILFNENSDLKSQILLLKGQLVQTNDLQVIKAEELESHKKKISVLMQQVEEMLSQEVNESNIVIKNIYSKMKSFREKMAFELRKEKNYSICLKEQVDKLTSTQEDYQRLVREELYLKNKYNEELLKTNTLQLKNEELSNQIFNLKSKLIDVESRLKLTDDKLFLYEQSIQENIVEIERKARKKAEIEMEEERKLVSSSEATYRLHYENDFGTPTISSQLDLSNESFSANFNQEKEMITKELEKKFNKELKLIESNLKQENVEVVKLLQSKLSEAATNIDKLKSIAENGRLTIRKQSDEINSLREEIVVQTERNRSIINGKNILSSYQVASSVKNRSSPDSVIRQAASDDSNNSIRSNRNISNDISPVKYTHKQQVKRQQQHQVVVADHQNESLLSFDNILSDISHSKRYSNSAIFQETEDEDTDVFVEASNRQNNKIEFQKQLSSMTNEQLENERRENIIHRQRETFYLKFIRQLDQFYKHQLQNLRNELIAVKTFVLSTENQSQTELHKIVSKISLQVNATIDKLNKKHDKAVLAVRTELTKAHSRELKQLESSYVNQLTTISQKHSKELEKVHLDVMTKAENIIRSNKPTTTINVPEDKTKAFESTLNGVIECLVSYKVITESTTSEIKSLAHSHYEPSVAATTAAKSILSNQLDVYIAIHNRQ